MSTIPDSRGYTAHEYPVKDNSQPTYFQGYERQELDTEMDLIGYLVLGMPNGIVPNVPSTPFPMPLDLDFTGLQDVPFELPNNGAQYYPAFAQYDFEQVEPLIFPDKWLHRTMELR